MILTHQQIKDAYEKEEVIINPFDEYQIQAASYDLRVGPQGATTSEKKIIDIKESGFITLKGGDFAIIITLEEVRLGPQYTGRFGLRSKYSRKGLIATAGPQIDPGFHGRLIVGLTNLTPDPITLAYKDDLLTAEFHRLEQPSMKPYDGPYQGKMELRPEDIEFIVEREGMAMSEMLTMLQSLSYNVASLTTEVKNLKWSIQWVIPTIVTIGIAIIAIIVTLKA